MEGFKVEIKEASKELTARERIALKDTGNAIKLDTACDSEPLIITPVAYAILAVHNEKSDNVDYLNYIVVDNAGLKYVTGSKSFWASFSEIWEEMAEEEEEYQIQIYKMDSKNYKGKQFLTCSIV